MANSTTPQHAITMRNALHSPLLRLPPELRNKIYSFVLGGIIYDISIPGMLRTYHLHGHIRYNDTICRQPSPTHHSILATCRQIYTETFLLPFTLNIFSSDAPAFQEFLNRITIDQQAAIKRVRLQLACYTRLTWDAVVGQGLKEEDFEFLQLLSGLRRVDVCVYERWCKEAREKAYGGWAEVVRGREKVLLWLEKALGMGGRGDVEVVIDVRGFA